MDKWKKYLSRFLPSGILLSVTAILPLFIPYVIASEIWIFALAAISFNLLMGYAGFMSFGHATFIGIGAYTAGLSLLHFNLPLLPVFILGAAAAALVALPIGFFCIQRREIYFVMLTFAFNLMIYHVAYQWTSLTGGDDGLVGLPRPNIAIGGWQILHLNQPRTFYYLTAIVFFISFVILNHLVRTPFGKILIGIRENENRMRAIGYNVKRYLLIGFVISGFFSGIAGVLYALLFRQVPLDLISWMTSGNIVFMAIIGGIGNLYGPVVGAGLFIWLSELISPIWARWPLILGLVFIIVVIFFNGGILEAWDRIVDQLRKSES